MSNLFEFSFGFTKDKASKVESWAFFVSFNYYVTSYNYNSKN
jgi:hypothetical protein